MKISFVFLSIVAIAWPAFASYDEILDVAERFQKQKKAVERLEDQKRGLMGKVYSLEKESKRISKLKNKLKNEKIILNRDLKKSSQVIVSLEKKVKGLTKGLQRRLDASRSMQKMPWMYILLSAYDPIGLERMTEIMDKINKSEAEIVREYVENIESLKKEKKKLYALAKKLVSVSKDIKEQEKQFQTQHNLKRGILKKIEAQIAREKRNIQRDRHLGIKMSSQNELENLKLLFATSFFDQKGQLPSPVDGELKHGYGLNRRLLKNNVQVMHKGNFYRTKIGAPVTAVAEGKVVHISKLKGLGNVVIVDHGSHYFAIFAHLGTSRIPLNSVVKAGDVLGYVGHRDKHLGSGLYFEIRHYSEAENPREWLKKRSSQKNLAHELFLEEGGA